MQGDTIKVALSISAYGDSTSASEVELYGSAVKFIAYWLMKQDGVGGQDTGQLLKEFNSNVCIAMAAGTEGTG